MIKQAECTELKNFKNCPPKVKTTLIWFGNFFMLGGNRDHDFTSVMKVISNAKKFLTDLKQFNFDSVSGP